MSQIRPHAFVLFGDLPKIGSFLHDLAQRGLSALVVSGPPKNSWEHRARGFLTDPDHPFSTITREACLPGGDHVGIVDQVTRWSTEFDIHGVFSATEIFVEAAGIVTDLLSLPGVSLRASRVCRNRLLQRRYLGEYSPVSQLVTTANRDAVLRDAARRLPVVVKPLTLWSSIGVESFDDVDDLRGRLSRLEPGDEVLVEDRVPGREFHIDAIAVDSELAFAAITQKGTNEQATRFFAELSHTTPPTDLSDATARAMIDTHAAIARRLHFGTGMIHAEYRVTPDDRIVMMEVAGRPPGDGCLHMHHMSTGQPLESALLDAALGLPVKYPAPMRRARQIYLEHPRGALANVAVAGPTAPVWIVDTGIWPLPRTSPAGDPGALRDVLVLKDRGETLTDITESGSRAVTALIDAPLDADIETLDRQTQNAITITTAPLA